MPRLCLACRRTLLPSERDLCCTCRADLPLTRFAGMSHNPMADRFNERIQERMDRAACPGGTAGNGDTPGGGLEPYAFAAALFHYSPQSPYSAITQHLKYNRGLAAGRRFAAQLGEDLAASPLFRDVDIVVPVPLHPSRLRKRGYNQAEIIARELARCLKATLVPNLLRRTRRTRTQTELTVEEKAANVSGAFEVAGNRIDSTRLSEAPSCRPLPRHILLVDDVFTTGATLAECHAALRKVFPPPVRISAASLGFTG